MTAVWLILGKVLGKVPRAVWGWLLVIVLALASLAALYHHAEKVGERKVQRIARADTTKAAIVRLDTAKAHLETTLARAAATRPATVSTGHRRQQLREAVTIVDSQTVTIAGKVDTVPTALVELLQADDAKIRADSVHQAATDAIAPAVAVTELAHAAVDTALTHQITAGDVAEPSHGHPLAIALAVVGTLGAAWALLHR